jgi:hypothetical protein
MVEIQLMALLKMRHKAEKYDNIGTVKKDLNKLL